MRQSAQYILNKLKAVVDASLTEKYNTDVSITYDFFEQPNVDVQRLKTGNFPIRANGQTAFHYIVARGSTDLLKFFLNNGADPDQTFMLKRLEHPWIPQKEMEPAIFSVFQTGHMKILEMLLDAGATIHKKGELSAALLVSCAASNDRPDLAERIINMGADINARTTLGRTPLHMACEKRLKVVKFLLQAGADYTIKDSQGRTALDIAIDWDQYQDNEELIEYLSDFIKNQTAPLLPGFASADPTGPK